MLEGMVGAGLLHAAFFLGALVTFQHSFDLTDQTHAVPVDLITIADKTNVQAMAPPQPEPPKVDVPLPDVPVPPEPDMVKAEPAPDVQPPKFKIKEDDKPDASQNLAALLNKLTAAPQVPKNAKAGPRVIEGVGMGNAMTADIVDALKSQISRCWSPPTGAPNAQDLVVDFDLSLNPDGSVGSLRLLSLGGNSYTRAAAEAGSRAVYQCQPYRLPADRYNQWRQINPLHLDPRQMMGQ